jgi:hypothetical protein
MTNELKIKTIVSKSIVAMKKKHCHRLSGTSNKLWIRF